MVSHWRKKEGEVAEARELLKTGHDLRHCINASYWEKCRHIPTIRLKPAPGHGIKRRHLWAMKRDRHPQRE